MNGIKSSSIKTFLPYLCSTTVEQLVTSMFRTELYQKLAKNPWKQVESPHINACADDAELSGAQKNKSETDGSSIASKQPSCENSPEKDVSTTDKIQNLNTNTEAFSQILWEFISERYAPYLELLRYCKVGRGQYAPTIRATLEKYFSDILEMEPKVLIKYSTEHNLDKLNMLVLQFGLKIIDLLSQDSDGFNSKWKTAHKKELASLKFLYDKINMSLQMKQLDESSKNASVKCTNSILGFYAMVFQEESIQASEEVSKDSNLPALKCARSILTQSEAGDALEKEIDLIAENCANTIERKRKISPKESFYANSQDPHELLMSFRKKRSHNHVPILGEIKLEDNESPKLQSMGFSDLKSMDKFDDSASRQTIFNRYSSQQDVNPFGSKLLESGNKLNLHKKQDKSKVQKYSPFQIRENNINLKKARKSLAAAKKGIEEAGLDNSTENSKTLSQRDSSLNRHFSQRSRTSGSNSFLCSQMQQKGKMAISKGRKEDKKKKPLKLSGALGMISRTSFAATKAKEVKEPELSVCPEKDEHSDSHMLQPSQRSVMSSLTKERNSQGEILHERDQEMEDVGHSQEKVLVFNTPSKSELLSQGVSNNEFDF